MRANDSDRFRRAARSGGRPRSGEVDEYAGYVALARKQGDSFEEGIATALEAVLVSPNFLYRIERDRAGAAGTIRRSPSATMSWRRGSLIFCGAACRMRNCCAPPAQRKLRQPEVLKAQVMRMLRDPKSSALVENFVGQWLQFKNIDVVRPDLATFPMFDDGLRLAMRRETGMFIDNIIRNDRQRPGIAGRQLHVRQ